VVTICIYSFLAFPVIFVLSRSARGFGMRQGVGLWQWHEVLRVKQEVVTQYIMRMIHQRELSPDVMPKKETFT